MATGTGLDAVRAANPDTDAGEDVTYLYRNTPLGETIPTAVEAADGATLDEIEGYGENVRRTTDPKPALYAELTRTELVEVFQTDGVERIRFAPGANPFWAVGAYGDRVFPKSADATDYVAYEEAIAGLETLAERHPDKLRIRTVGHSPGHRDLVAGEDRGFDVKLVELSENVGGSFADKETIVCSLGIHGDERSGVEAGLRFVEDVLAGRESAVADRLDQMAMAFVFPNPDGWLSRSVLVEDDDGSGNTFHRVTGAGVDPNRQYPTVGWIDPNHNPAEPNGSDLVDDQEGIDSDVDERYTDTVPGALSLVDALREYDGVEYAADFHGMFGSENAIEGLMMNDQYGVEERADLDALNDSLADSLDGELGPLLSENEAALRKAARQRARRRGGVPSTSYEYGTILDTIGYTTTGGFGSWFADAVEKGGIAATGISFEMALDNRSGGRMEFIPGLNEVHVVGYRTCMRELAVHATRSPDTAIDDNGRSTAYVGTDSLTRSSADLAVDPATSVERTTRTVTVPEGGRSLSVSLESSGQVHVGVRPETGVSAQGRLRDPAGSVRRRERIDGGGFQHGTDWAVADAEPGEWTVDLAAGREATVTVQVTAVDANGPPDPGEVLGYQQRSYEVSPLGYLAEYGTAIDGGSTRRESVQAVADGALRDGGTRAVDNLVVIHDDGRGDRAYLRELDRFVDDGGRLVLTDAGVNLLGDLSAGGAGSISSRDVSQITVSAASLDDKRDDRLLDGVRSIEREVWKAPPLGYQTSRESPMTVVDGTAFERAGGTIAATTQGDVSVGRLDGVVVLGSVLPPASQGNLHPFGLYDDALSSMGHRLVVNALGHDQGVRSSGVGR